MLARSKGGSEKLHNLRLLHQDCHGKAHQVLTLYEIDVIFADSDSLSVIFQNGALLTYWRDTHTIDDVTIFSDQDESMLLTTHRILTCEGYGFDDVDDIILTTNLAHTTARIQVSGISFYVFESGEDGETAAYEYLTDDSETWKACVAADLTTESLSDWASDAITHDGWESVLSLHQAVNIGDCGIYAKEL